MPAVSLDDKKNTFGQKLQGEHLLGNRIPQKHQTIVLSQIPHTQAGSGYTQLHPEAECYVGVLKE